jgi:hypothetical protein
VTKQVFDRVKVVTATTGTGNITLGAAVNGFQTWAAAGAADGDNIAYVIEDGYAWEIGWGVLGGTGTVLTRNVISSSNAGAALNLSGNAIIYSALIKSEYDNKVEKTGATMTGDLTISKTNPTLTLAGDSNSYYPAIVFQGASFAAGTQATIQGYQGLFHSVPAGKQHNFQVGGQSVLSMGAGSVTFGPSGGTASDDAVYFDCTNYYHFWTFRRWAAGVPSTQAQLQVADAGFYWGANAHTFRSTSGGTVYGTIDSNGLDITVGTIKQGGSAVALQSAVDAKISAVNGAVKAAGSANNANLWFTDHLAANQGVVFWDRTADAITIRRLGADGSTPEGEIQIGNGTVALNGITALTLNGAALNAANGLLKLDSGGRITAGQLPSNVPTIAAADGGMEIGSYVDFHLTGEAGGTDFKGRIQVNTNSDFVIDPTGNNIFLEAGCAWLNSSSLLFQHDGTAAYIRTQAGKGDLWLGANGNNRWRIVSDDGSLRGTTRLYTNDIVCSRGNGTGVIYLNGAEDRYLYYDGTSYVLATANLTVGGQIYASGSQVVSLANDVTITGPKRFRTGGGNIAGGDAAASLQAFNDNGQGAHMAFHRSGAYAVYFGLDADNVLRIGGWSAPANVWQLDMNGLNTLKGSNAGLVLTDRAGTGTWTNYNYGGIWRLYNGADRFTLDANGRGWFNGGLDLNNSISIAVDVWNTSRDGQRRMYFATNGTSYWESGNTAHEWRKSDDSWMMQLTNGSLTVTGNITSSSDERLKTNIRQLDYGLEAVNKLRGVRYEKDGEEQIGVVAQEVQKIAPEVVREDGDGFLSVDYGRLTPILIEAVKTLTARVEELEARLA